MSQVSQVALCTSDLPRTIRTFIEVLDFSNAGGRPRWGEYASQVQELGTGDDGLADPAQSGRESARPSG